MTVLNIKDKIINNKLDLSNMHLTEIPVSELAPLMISHLDLSNNKITSTNNVFTLLPSLVKLDLSNNQIKKVAGDIVSLQKLIHLSLANNMIEDLPKGLSNLKKLKYLNLNNNPLKSELFKAIGPSQTNKQCKTAAANAKQYLKDSKNGSKYQDKKSMKRTKKRCRTKKKSGGDVSKVLCGFSMYALSYYSKKTYNNVKAKVLPVWASNLDLQVTSKMNYYLQYTGAIFNLAVQTSIQAPIKYTKYTIGTLESLWNLVFN